MSDETKRDALSTGANARPLDTGIAQTAAGLPDDTGRPVPLGEAEERRIAETLTGDRSEAEAETEAHPS